jgi:hypothetical protein
MDTGLFDTLDRLPLWAVQGNTGENEMDKFK